jgi:Leucine-rich repeat (LRR) protein
MHFVEYIWISTVYLFSLHFKCRNFLKSHNMKNRQLTIVFSLLSISLFAQISSTEKQTLQDLYTSTNGEQWNNSWDLNQPVNQWEGITIKNDKVVSISLMFNNMEGELPNSLNKLKYLEVLELSFNKLEGSIPTELGDLKKLKVLAFNGNNLTGIIPSNIGNLSDLTQLHLSSNQLTGEIPQSVTNLEYLEVLNVFDNELTGNIPSQLANSRNLKQLLVAENNLADTNEFSESLLSNGSKLDFINPYVVSGNKGIIAIETEDEN